MISNKGLVSISTFMSSCDDLINGKFIFAGNKVANILNAINESPELYEVITECLKDFNYDKELGRARVKLPTKKGTFKMPEDKSTIIALVFCMLVEIQENKLDLKQLLADYFESEEKPQFENFASSVIVPFKNAVAYLFDIEGANKFKPQPQTESQKEEKAEAPTQVSSKAEKYLNSLKTICDDIVSDMDYAKVKEEFADDLLYLTDIIKDVANKKDVKEASALAIGLCYVLKQVKKLRFYEEKLRDAMEEMYLDNEEWRMNN